MKAVILAASQGKRLEPLTRNIPKCLLPFGNETVLERQIRILEDAGIEKQDIIVVGGYGFDKIKEVVCVNVINNDKYLYTDNSYSLLLAIRDIEDDIVLLDGDLVFEKDVICNLINSDGNTIIGIQHNGAYGKTGIEVDQNERIVNIGKHIMSDIAYASLMRIQADSLNKLKIELQNSKNWKTWYTIPVNRLLNKITFHLCMLNSKMAEINNYFDYIEAKRLFEIEDFKILVTGASGFLGRKIVSILKRNYDVVGIKGKSLKSDMDAVDLTNQLEVSAYIEWNRPSVIIHTAGMPDPEDCDENKEKAYQINVQSVKILTDICQKKNIKLVHISTDYVFDGEQDEEYCHDAIRLPKNYYGETKCLAEDIVKKYKNSLIVRVPVLYGYNDENDKETFPIKIIRKLSKREYIKLDCKQIRYPVLIDDVAFAIQKALPQTGIIHVTSNKAVTKYEWAKIIAREFDLDESLIQMDEGKSFENRPPHVKLKVTEKDYEVSNVIAGTKILCRQMRCVFKLIYKSNPYEHIYNINIGDYRYRLGQKLGDSLSGELCSRVDYIVPVPTSGLYYAMGVAERTGIPYLQALVKPDTMMRSFQIADIALRERVISNKIIPIADMLKNKRIALIDEAIFTGTTLRVVCDMVKACGTSEIYICIPTPICWNLCRQYVQPERKLLSHQVNEKNLCEYFKVDGIFFQPYDNFMDSVKNVGQICFECFEEKEREREFFSE